MLQVKVMAYEDINFAISLANTMDWNMEFEDFAIMKELEPGGCFLLHENFTPIGIATCINYNGVGWFGNLVIDEKYRRQGAGRFLVRYAVDYLYSRGAESIGLYAYDHLIDFYGRLGFKADEDFVVLKGNNIKGITDKKLPEIQEQHINSITTFDCECFGGNRERLIRLILSHGHCGSFVVEKKQLVGFAIAKVYEQMIEVGPLVCLEGREDTALTLLDNIFQKFTNRSVQIYIPKKRQIMVSHLVSKGLEEDFSVIRMFLGKPSLKNCIYIAESLERG
jgi:GNAT superfamily N-acetyltransferase